MDSTAEPNPKVWECVIPNSGAKGCRCRVCEALHVREARRTAAHENTEVHKQALKHHDTIASAPSDTLQNTNELPLSAFVQDGVRSLLDALAALVTQYSGNTPSSDDLQPQPRRPSPLIDWGLSENTELEPSPEARAAAQIAEHLLQYLDMEPASDEEVEERSEDEGEKDELEEPTVAVDDGDEESDHGQKRQRTRDHTQYSRQWSVLERRMLSALRSAYRAIKSGVEGRELGNGQSSIGSSAGGKIIEGCVVRGSTGIKGSFVYVANVVLARVSSGLLGKVLDVL
ncbi:hypothetical protein B0H13DRAFT_1869998 [Mycena leptocephala]|nr:hypothetical protein B0H13DRAFT_1869998 [Mycena leptocephala]